MSNQPNYRDRVTATRAAKPNEADRLNEIRTVSNNMRHLALEYSPNGNRELNALLEEKTAQAIDSNWKIESFRDWCGEVFTERIKLARPKSSGPIVVESPGFGQSELDGFSFARMITGLASGKLDGLEREMSDEAAMKSRRSQPAGGAFIPASVLSHRGQGRRDMYAGVDSAGGYAVGHTEAMSFIDLLRASSLVLELGATELNGLEGDYSESKLTGGVSATWLEEGETSTESTPTWGQVKLHARRVCADIEFSESLAMNTNANIEMRVRKLIADQLAQAIDIAAINGDGAGSTPLGIMNTTGIGAVEMGTNGLAVTYAKLIDLEGEIDVDNAMTGAPAFLTNTSVKKKLRTTLRETTNGDDFIYEPDPSDRRFGLVAGYRCGVSNNIPSTIEKGSSGATLSAIILGVWQELLVGSWGDMSIIVDPFSKRTQRITGVNIARYCDVAVRHAESFAVIDDIVTT